MNQSFFINFLITKSYLRDGEIIFPNNIEKLQEILKEAQYFQIEPLIGKLKEKVEKSINFEYHYVTVRYLPGKTIPFIKKMLYF